MLRTVSRLRLQPVCTRTSASSSNAPPAHNPALHRQPGERDISNMDLLEERIRTRQASREITVQGQKLKWAYRSEMVRELDLDMNHRRIWIAFSIIIAVGFGSFVYVKSCVVLSRREEMEQREKIRRELNLQGEDRKKIAIVDS